MRSRLILLMVLAYMGFAVGCTSKPAADNSNGNQMNSSNTAPDSSNNAANSMAPAMKKEEPRREEKRAVVVPAGTAVVVSLGSELGSKVSQSGQSFTGSVAKDVQIDGVTAIAKGTAVSGTVTDAKALGKFAGGAVLALKIDSFHIGASDVPVQAGTRTFAAKGKGKRSAVLTGGGAALGGIIGGLAGGGKGAAIGLLAGGGAGAGGAAFTGNKDIVLPAEATVSFDLTQPLELK
jgi:hypothetical protein